MSDESANVSVTALTSTHEKGFGGPSGSETLARRALRDSELSYRRLFEAARDGILILNLDSGCIDDVNPFLCELLGFVRDEMLGRTVAELSPFKDLETNHEMLKRVQQHGYARYEDLPLETRDGQHIQVEFVCNVYPAGDTKVIQCNVRDITERKAAEIEIARLNAETERKVVERTAQLQAVNEELEAFSYTVSHDLRSPLRHVLGYIEMLQKDTTSTLSSKSSRYMATISHSADRMGRLIDDLLTFSRVGRTDLQKTTVDLDELVRESVEDARPDTKERNLVWLIHPLPFVQADRALLRMALFNLINNAVKFTSGRAQAEIEIGSAPGVETGTVVFIRDNGAGFDPKFAGKLFGVFQRLHGETEFEGTGIGLANVRRIITRHGGRTWAEAAVGVGATFSFSLP